MSMVVTGLWVVNTPAHVCQYPELFNQTPPLSGLGTQSRPPPNNFQTQIKGKIENVTAWHIGTLATSIIINTTVCCLPSL